VPRPSSRLRLSPARIAPEAARELLDRGATLVDSRQTDNPALALEGALRLPPDQIPQRLDELPRGSPVLLACT
jgi:hypothetical protein